MEIKKKLLDIVRDKVRFKHYSISTEKSYIHWMKHYIFFHNKKYLTHLLQAGIDLRNLPKTIIPILCNSLEVFKSCWDINL